MRALRIGFGSLAATIAFASLPAFASAEYLVPPGNSAATQYTEAVPTAGGDRSTEKGRKEKHATPAEALGADNVRRLDAEGAEGRAAAELATATAPASPAPERDANEEGQQAAGGGNGNGKSGGDGSGGGDRAPSGGSGSTTSIPDGSSGFGEVVAQATGSSSSGQLGLLLPFAILGAIAWALAYLVRQRRQPTA